MNYEEARIEIIYFGSSDIVTASGETPIIDDP